MRSLVRLGGASIVAIALGGLVHVSGATAEELRYRGVTHNIAATAEPVAEGHVLGVAKFSGLAFFDGGEIATTRYIVTFDYVGGNGPWRAYHTLTFEDGSTLMMRVLGSSRMEGSRTALVSDEITVVGGSGRFANATGEGKAGDAGWRVAPMADGGDTFYDITLNLE